ncbi:family 10 glycosylhydrolase [Lusitaniella coriacea]|nr:family 10 glycosylhydrolase [Lusitaniella coriacea]
MTLARKQLSQTIKMKHRTRRLLSSFIAIGSITSQMAIAHPVAAQTAAYCQLPANTAKQKDDLRQAALKGNSEAQERYEDLIEEHGDWLRQCRDRVWPKTQAIWLRLYPCDARPGAMDAVLDRIVNKGYNQIHVEVFYDARVLLPANDNPTTWPSVARTPETRDADLLAMAIEKGRDRGLKVYAWAFTMNFGYAYAQRPDRQQVLARNGKGQNSLSVVHDGSQAFIDPYNPQARNEYYQMVQSVAQRRPDGMLFDYIRYPRGTGNASVAAKVQDLWIYGEASLQTLYQRGLNNQGRALIQSFVRKGSVSASDIETAQRRYPQERTPNWQGRNLSSGNSRGAIQSQLWNLAVAHAAQGVIDFLSLATRPLEQANIPAGAVFFPDANQAVGQQGYDSRLQPWDRFPTSLEWHPMAYAVCGNTNCIVDLVQQAVRQAPNQQVKIIPALAGYWGRRDGKRPSLEEQMAAIRQQVPRINAVSHFAYSWQEPKDDSQRRSCRF